MSITRSAPTSSLSGSLVLRLPLLISEKVRPMHECGIRGQRAAVVSAPFLWYDAVYLNQSKEEPFMVTMAQRIEALRTERNLSHPALASALGLPRMAVEKFETGRQTPTQDQQAKMAAYFGVSQFYLRGLQC